MKPKMPRRFIHAPLRALGLSYLKKKEPELFAEMVDNADKLHRELCPGAPHVSMAAMFLHYMPKFKIHQRRTMQRTCAAFKCCIDALMRRRKLFAKHREMWWNP